MSQWRWADHGALYGCRLLADRVAEMIREESPDWSGGGVVDRLRQLGFDRKIVV